MTKISLFARNDDAREALSKLRGASDFYAPHHHFAFLISHSIEVFKRDQVPTRPKGALNPEP